MAWHGCVRGRLMARQALDADAGATPAEGKEGTTCGAAQHAVRGADSVTCEGTGGCFVPTATKRRMSGALPLEE